MNSGLPTQDDGLLALSRFEHEIIEIFVHSAQLLGLPKSVGEIYGLLYGCDRSLTLDQIVELLSISKGSASQGLRFLCNMTAVKKVYIPGDRRDHYVAEVRLRRLVSGVIRERVEPHLENGLERISQLTELATESGNPHQIERVKRLRNWHKRADQLIPMVRKLLPS